MHTTPNVSELESTKKTVKFFEGLLRSTPNGIVVTDASQNIVLVNGRFSSIFSQHWRDIIETNLFVWLQQLGDGAVDTWTKLMESVYREGHCYDVNFNMNSTDGIKYLSVNASLVEQETVEDQGIIISNWRDITKQVEMEEQVAMSERLAVLGKLSGSIAHEIRNPLATIDISALNLKRSLKDADEKTKSQIDRIIKQVKETVDTIQSLQDLSKLEAPAKSRMDITDVINSGIGILEIPEGIHLVMKVTKKELFVDVDEKQISIVIRNILANAIHAMQDQGTVWLNAYKDIENNINISIRDSGPGIKAEHINKVFQSFFGTKVKGFGYGLTICKMIMEKHGGTIDVVSKEGEGATFTLHFSCTDIEKQAT